MGKEKGKGRTGKFFGVHVGQSAFGPMDIRINCRKLLFSPTNRQPIATLISRSSPKTRTSIPMFATL